MPKRRYPKTPTVTTNFAVRLAYGLNEIPLILPISLPYLRLELARGNLKTIKLGRRRLVLREQLDAWLARGAQAAAQISARASAGSEKS